MAIDGGLIPLIGAAILAALGWGAAMVSKRQVRNHRHALAMAALDRAAADDRITPDR